MRRYSRSFYALWTGEMISNLRGAGGIINGLPLFESTGSKEWMGALWLVYFIPSLVPQGISAPYLNQVNKGKALKIIQLVRMGGYLLPLAGWLFQSHTSMIAGLVILQCDLGFFAASVCQSVFFHFARAVRRKGAR